MHTNITDYTGRIAALRRQLADTPLHHIRKRHSLSRELKTLEFIESDPKAAAARYFG